MLILALGSGSIIGIALTASMFTILAAILLGMGVLSAQAKRYFEELFHLGTAVLQSNRDD